MAVGYAHYRVRLVLGLVDLVVGINQQAMPLPEDWFELAFYSPCDESGE
jgi:hypothetical protein